LEGQEATAADEVLVAGSGVHGDGFVAEHGFGARGGNDDAGSGIRLPVVIEQAGI
jgi:hypothetical protein